MDTCSWFSIESVDVVRGAPEGTLYRIVTKRWESYHPNGSYEKKARRIGGEASDDYVFCSLKRPAVIFESEGQWYAHTLAPGSSAGVAGYNHSSYITYMAACHGIEVGDPYSDGTETALRLGYAVDPSVAEQITLSKPEDIIR
jgi:hypothetical protein